MNTGFFTILTSVLLLVLIAGIVGMLISAAEQSAEKRKQDLQARRMARQPWDPEGTSGRGNR